MKNTIRLSALCIFLLFVVADVSPQTQSLEPSIGWQRLNSAFDAAQGADEDSVRKLVHAAYEVEGVPATAFDVLDPLTERLVKAEVNYRSGKKGAIDESNVVKSVNAVAKNLGAPEYAYTSSWEVRKLRSRLLAINPGLISRDSLKRGGKDRNGPVSRKLGPIEAFHVAAMMIRQKILNPEYQLTQSEQVEKWHVLHTPDPASKLHVDDRRKAMLDIATHHMVLEADRLTLETGEMLTTLGIE